MLSNFFVQAEHKRNTILKKKVEKTKKALIIKQEQSRQYIYIFLKKRLKFVVDSILFSLSLSVVLKKFVVFMLQFFFLTGSAITKTTTTWLNRGVGVAMLHKKKNN